MSQFENQRCFSQDTFGMPQEHPTPLSNTYTFNPAHHHPPSPLILSPFTPRPMKSRWDDEIKLFDPASLSPLQENLEIELEMMQKEEKLAQKKKDELPFIKEEAPKPRRSTRIKKTKAGIKKQQKKLKQTQTKLLSFLGKKDDKSK